MFIHLLFPHFYDLWRRNDHDGYISTKDDIFNQPLNFLNLVYLRFQKSCIVDCLIIRFWYFIVYHFRIFFFFVSRLLRFVIRFIVVVWRDIFICDCIFFNNNILNNCNCILITWARNMTLYHIFIFIFNLVDERRQRTLRKIKFPFTSSMIFECLSPLFPKLSSFSWRLNNINLICFWPPNSARAFCRAMPKTMNGRWVPYACSYPRVDASGRSAYNIYAGCALTDSIYSTITLSVFNTTWAQLYSSNTILFRWSKFVRNSSCSTQTLTTCWLNTSTLI